MASLLFETPWWILAVPAILGVCLWSAGNNRGNRRLMAVGYVLFALAIAWTTANWLVDTDHEKVLAHSRAFIVAANKQDWKAFRAQLASDAHIGDWRGADRIADGAHKYFDQFEIKDISLPGLDAQEDPPGWAATASVVCDFGAFGRLPSRWKFNWIEGPQGWQIDQITLLEINRTDASALEKQYFGGK